ncbi:MAG TPA: M20 family metallopeptidase [Bacillales bacterium]|nr:M20 family metallopeptidase [Bacillales bacterium]
MDKLYDQLNQVYEEMVGIRRELHQNPELSFKEVKTSRFIAAYHQKLGHEVRAGVGGNGVVARLKGAKPGPTVALRADFDALPIQEERDVPYKSRVDGVMHACGHDGHTATLLGLARVLNSMKEELEGTVVFIHQHAEELPPGGARAMIEDGCLDGVDVIFGTHLQSQIPLGEVRCRTGPLMAAPDRFDIKIQGKGGHGARPHETKDSIVAGGQLIGSLQQIVSRRVDPLEAAVVSVCSFEAANSYNVIADAAVLKGTVRTFKENIRNLIKNEIEQRVKAVCLAAGATYSFEYLKGAPALVNHKEETEFIAGIAASVPGVQDVKESEPHMGGEDFSYYLKEVKGCYFFTGAQNPEWEESYPHHHPMFDIDERALLVAAKVLGKATVTYLKNH